MANNLRAAGFLIFRTIGAEFQYLLMQTSYGKNHWTPPKGHVDPGETDEETAFRETSEEAGLLPEHLLIHKDFKRTLSYDVNNRPKIVVYWLAQLKNPDTPIKMSDEHQDFKWLPVDEACRYAQYEDTVNMIQEAEEFLKKKFKS